MTIRHRPEVRFTQTVYQIGKPRPNTALLVTMWELHRKLDQREATLCFYRVLCLMLVQALLVGAAFVLWRWV